jgi:PAS domain S-box-containing protein
MADIPTDIPFRGIVEQSLAGIYLIQDAVFQYANATFAGIFGYSADELIGKALVEVAAPDSREEVLRNYQRRISGEASSIRFVARGEHKNGGIVHLEVHGSRVLFRGRPAVVGVAVNITEQVRQQEELRDSRERLRELASYINTVREEQRARIARELHDVVGGMLTSMKLDIQRIGRRSADPQISAIVADLLALVQESIGTVRSISEDLRPGVLDHLGLFAALKAALRQFAERTEVQCSLVPEESDLQLSQARATAIYRIFQEALTNIARHAQASAVEVRLTEAAGMLTLEIQDNGRGLAASTETAGQRIGLVSMAERARELGGRLAIGDVPAGGTLITLRVPVEDPS